MTSLFQNIFWTVITLNKYITFNQIVSLYSKLSTWRFHKHYFVPNYTGHPHFNFRGYLSLRKILSKFWAFGFVIVQQSTLSVITLYKMNSLAKEDSITAWLRISGFFLKKLWLSVTREIDLSVSQERRMSFCAVLNKFPYSSEKWTVVILNTNGKLIDCP